MIRIIVGIGYFNSWQ